MANQWEVKKLRSLLPEEAMIEEVDLIEEEDAHMAIVEDIKIEVEVTMEIVLLVGISEIDPEDASTVVKRAI
uniref:Uncharacterized protein n=1 Tax=Noccaea caerulescens TaxID=107243 RepID=A0A1J3GRB7_NOCCA